MSVGVTERELVHKRDFSFSGYRRADGNFDIEGRMTDRKSYSFPNDFRGEISADEPLHDMRVRVTIDEGFRILDIVTETAAAPFEICPAITPSFATLKGATIGRGWTKLLRERFGGAHGCTHHVELLRTLATVAFQTVYGELQRQRRAQGIPQDDSGGKRPVFLDTCHALASDSEIVKTRWPEFYRPKA